MATILEIKDLHVTVDGKEVLKGLNLKVESGQVHVIMGPNGSGKSTLASVAMGHPKYEIIKGKMTFLGKDLSKLKPDERARLGLFLSFQSPEEISGVTISNFLKTTLNSIRKERITMLKFRELVKEKAAILKLDESFISRYLNDGFSGGEKKKAEMLQLLVLDPKLAILDEVDSGLDIDALKSVSTGINSFLKKDKAVLIITHYKRLLEHIKPDKVSILMDGRIVSEGKAELVDHLEEKGYAWVNEKKN